MPELDINQLRAEIKREVLDELLALHIEIEELARMTTDEAAKALNKPPQFIRIGLQNKRFPWGYAVKMPGGKWSYFINRKKFFETEGVENRKRAQMG